MRTKKYSRSFLSYGWTPDVTWTILPMSLLHFYSLIVLISLLSMKGQRALRFHQKYLNLCSEDERRSYGFGTEWGWIIHDRIYIFGWTIPLRRFSLIRPLLFSMFICQSAKSLGFGKVTLPESFVLLGCLNSMTVQAQTVDWNEVGLKNTLCSPYPVSDPQVSRTLPLSPLPLSPFAWANCGGKVKGEQTLGSWTPLTDGGMTDPANRVAALRFCEPWIGLFHKDLACRLGGMLWWWL